MARPIERPQAEAAVVIRLIADNYATHKHPKVKA
jgi:hypothetical protein